MIDLNSDLGEGAGTEAEIVPLISSANVCCGAHAGNEEIIRETLAICAKQGVTVGAHPGYADRGNFGRLELNLPAQEVFQLADKQVRFLQLWASEYSVTLRYIKPHGGLYHQCHRDVACADTLISVAKKHNLAVMGLPYSLFAERANGVVRYLAEGFADRRYRADGSLVPRTEANAMITDPAEAVEQALHLIKTHGIETLCVHGDNPHAIEFVRQIRTELQQRHIVIRPVL